MAGMMDHVATLNSAGRTALAVVGALGAAGLFGYRAYHVGGDAKDRLEEAKKKLEDVQADQKSKSGELDRRFAELNAKNEQIALQAGEIKDLHQTIEQKNELIEKQATEMRLLKKEHRLAIISVLKQEGTGADMVTTVRWVEVDENNRPLEAPRICELKGDIVKVDAWVVKFDDKYIEEADLIRGASICLFRRIHGEFLQPNEFYALDKVGQLQNAYRRGGANVRF